MPRTKKTPTVNITLELAPATYMLLERRALRNSTTVPGFLHTAIDVAVKKERELVKAEGWREPEVAVAMVAQAAHDDGRTADADLAVSALPPMPAAGPEVKS